MKTKEKVQERREKLIELSKETVHRREEFAIRLQEINWVLSENKLYATLKGWGCGRYEVKDVRESEPKYLLTDGENSTYFHTYELVDISEEPGRTSEKERNRVILFEVLKKLEWYNEENWCPYCENSREAGHEDSCHMKRVLEILEAQE